MITYPRFVLRVYLDKIIQHVVLFDCPGLEFCVFLNYSMRRQRVGFKGHTLAEIPTVRPMPFCT